MGGKVARQKGRDERDRAEGRERDRGGHSIVDARDMGLGIWETAPIIKPGPLA